MDLATLKQTHEAKIGSLELSVKDRETVNVPVWAGVGAIVVGGIALLAPKKSWLPRLSGCRA